MDHRSFPDAADGRPLPPGGYELMSAGLNGDDARFVANQLGAQGYYIVHPDQIGWPEIKAFNAALRAGQGVREDGGGYFRRCILALFNIRFDPVETYQEAARRLLAEAQRNEPKV